MAFDPAFLEQVRAANDIVQVVQASVPLKRSGASWKGLCPFHAERTPSFHVHPARQAFHCFGCGEGGDVFSFVQKRDRVDFAESVRLLAERAGIPLPEERAGSREEDAAKRKAEEETRRLLELAEAWFRRHLEEASGTEARAYAEGRGLDAATRERFALGFAPADPQALLRAAAKAGHGPEALEAAGLAVRGERGPYARFRGRLIFPIRDPRGRVAGFGGRLLGPGEPKYLNSPEGPLFSKGSLLYPWPQAKDALGRLREALVCEGYLDAIACHQAGLAQAVATLGTALTPQHAKLLKRYVDRVVLVFDADAAGLKAARRAGEPLLEAGLEVRVARLAGAKDPDELLRRSGPEALREAVASARPLTEFCVRAAVEAGGAKPGAAARAAALRDAFPLLARMPSRSEADAALAEAAAVAGIDPEAARADYEAFRAGTPAPAPAAAAPAPEAAARPSAPLALVETELLALLVAHPELVAEAREELGGAELCTPELRAAAGLLWKAPRGAVLLLPDDGSEEFKAGDALLSELSQRRLPQLAPPTDSLKDLLVRRHELLLERDVAARTQALRQASPDDPDTGRLLREVTALRQALLELRHDRR